MRFQLFFLLLSLAMASKGLSQEGKLTAFLGRNEIEDKAFPAWMAHWEIARVLSYQKKYDESLAEYKKVIEAQPDLVQAKVEMAQIYYYSGKNDDALSILKTIPEEKWNNAALSLAANIYTGQGDFAKAGPLFRLYLEQQPEDHKTRFKYAEMLSWQKDYPASLRQYEKLLNSRPDDRQLRRKYAMVLIWNDQLDDGIAELRRSLSDE